MPGTSDSPDHENQPSPWGPEMRPGKMFRELLAHLGVATREELSGLTDEEVVEIAARGFVARLEALREERAQQLGDADAEITGDDDQSETS